MIRFDKRKIKRKLSPSKNYFLSLATSIIYQQISTKAGDVIHGRFLKLFGKKAKSPENFFLIPDEDLRAVGLSQQKVSYLRDLSNKFLEKAVEPRKIPKMTDDEVREHLIQVKGIGIWTADMFLIFALNRPNILPLGDLGIRKGFQKVYGLKTLPTHKTMMNLAKEYAGEHTHFSLFLWQSLDE